MGHLSLSSAKRQMLTSLVALVVVSCSAIGQVSSPSATPPASAATPSEPARSSGSPAASGPSATPEITFAASSPTPLVTGAATETPTRSPGELDLSQVAWFQADAPGDHTSHVLYVGRLDGRAFEALRASAQIDAAGPVDDQVLAWWREGGESVVALVDTADGTSREVMRTDEHIDAAAFGADGDWYWVSRTEGDLDLRGMWRSSLDGGPRERIADGWRARFTQLTPSADGSLIAAWSEDDAGRSEYRVLDTTRRRLTLVPNNSHGDVRGILGDELIVWTEPATDFLVTPRSLTAIAPDGSSRIAVSEAEVAAAVYPDLDGSPRLIYEAQGEEGRVALSKVAVGETEGDVFYSYEDDYSDPAVQLIHSLPYVGLEVRGWVPVFPGADAMLESGEEVKRGLPRLLAPLDGGPPIDVGPEPSAAPAPRPSGG